MTSRQVRVGVAAETIPSRGAGLGHFVLKGVSIMAKVRPEWRFDIVATSGFEEWRSLGLPNVSVKYWDDRLVERIPRSVVSAVGECLGRGGPGSYYLLRRYRQLGLKYGRLDEIWREMSNADIVWLPHFDISPLTLSPPKLVGSRLPAQILTIHDIHPALFPQEWPPQGLARFWNRFVAYCRTCDHIITHTMYQRRMIVEHLSLSRDRVSVVAAPPPIGTQELLAVGSDAAGAARLPSELIHRPFALYPGSGTHSHKNHARLILAWAQLRTHLGPRLPLLVCTAKGHRWPYLRELIETLDLRHDVFFTDTVPTETLASLIRACLFVVVPTLYEGGGSGPVADACIVGRPVVCSRIPPIVEQLHAYGDLQVLYFNPENVPDIVRAVRECLSNPEHWGHAASINSEKLRAVVGQLWRRWGESYASEFEALLAR